MHGTGVLKMFFNEFYRYTSMRDMRKDVYGDARYIPPRSKVIKNKKRNSKRRRK